MAPRTTVSQDVQKWFSVQLAFAKFLSKMKGNFQYSASIMDTALAQKFRFILDRNLAKANCTGNRVCTSCDKVASPFVAHILLAIITQNSSGGANIAQCQSRGAFVMTRSKDSNACPGRHPQASVAQCWRWYLSTQSSLILCYLWQLPSERKVNQFPLAILFDQWCRR